MKKALEKLPFYNDLVLPYHFLQAVVAGVRFGFPGRKLHVIGVTGTNGKTSTCFMIWKMLNTAGIKTGLMTTVAWGVGDLEPELGHMTTVDANTLNSRISKIVESGATHLVLEVTSHALAEFRTLGIPCDIAVFTNLTHDHLDYHKTFARYRAAKGKLFKKAKFAVLNADDSSYDYYRKLCKKYASYGIKNGENRAFSVKLAVSGVKYSLGDIKLGDADNGMRSGVSSSELSLEPPEPSETPETLEPLEPPEPLARALLKTPVKPQVKLTIRTKIPGEFNIYNSLAAAVVGKKLGLSDAQIEQGIYALDSVEGRMNLVDEGQDFTVIVDYAHAPDALEKVFDSVATHKGRIIAVHGGAGRRDPSTRPIRGAILGKNADVVIITEDDSRDEDPEKIAAGFIQGAEKAGKVLGKNLFKEMDREKAIALAFSKAKTGDLVLLLGKGHEKTILRADGPHEFEDIKVAKKLLRKKINWMGPVASSTPKISKIQNFGGPPPDAPPI